MILQKGHWHLGYDQILKDYRRDESKTVWILCNADADAMSAARILCYMLRSDGIPYQLRPCTSLSALKKILRDESNVAAVVLLNLGASRNLTRIFESVNIYVMDCRRPFHLANIHAEENVVLFWDDVVLDEIPSDGDNLSAHDSSSSSDSSDDDDQDDNSDTESSSDDDEAEFQDGDVQGVKDVNDSNDGEAAEPTEDSMTIIEEPEREPDEDYDAEDEHEEETGSKTQEREDEGSPSGKRRKTDTVPSLTPQELHRNRQDRLKKYYAGGTYHASPVAYVAYQLSLQLRFGNVGDLLWLACVGLTDAHIHSRIDFSGYTALALDLRTHCNRLFPNDTYSRVRDTVYAEHLQDAEASSLTQISLSESGRILSENDFKFFLMQHTSLLDSMVCSSYVSTKMQLWNNRGMQKLYELLAKMGIPLAESRQPFAFMQPTLRRRLQEKFDTYAEDYGLDHFHFTSFKRVTGYRSLLTASDMCYAVTALLECDAPASKARVVSPNPSEDEDQHDVANVDSAETQEDREAIQSFNVAYDALNSNGAPSRIILSSTDGSEGNSLANLVNGGSVSSNTGIGAGLRLAMSLQRSIIATAASLVERNAITRLRYFRYAYLTCTSDASHGTRASKNSAVGTPNKEETDKSHVFAKPLALNQLAHYLMDMHRENGKWVGSKSRPLVLMAEKPRTATYMVVGYEYQDQKGDLTRNNFGKKFELAAQLTNGTVKFDSFDSNVVEVDGNDVQKFIENLHYSLDKVSS